MLPFPDALAHRFYGRRSSPLDLDALIRRCLRVVCHAPNLQLLIP
jgi:hypothetical protein